MDVTHIRNWPSLGAQCQAAAWRFLKEGGGKGCRGRRRETARACGRERGHKRGPRKGYRWEAGRQGERKGKIVRHNSLVTDDARGIDARVPAGMARRHRRTRVGPDKQAHTQTHKHTHASITMVIGLFCYCDRSLLLLCQVSLTIVIGLF